MNIGRALGQKDFDTELKSLLDVRAFIFLLSEKNEMIAPCDKNEVVKKASSLTANGDPR